MSLAAALRFISRIPEDSGLRRRLNDARTPAERTEALNQTAGPFSDEQFEEAIRSLHVKCQTAEQAAELMELRLWWHLVVSHSTESQPTESAARDLGSCNLQT
jgi:hypothetical protein